MATKKKSKKKQAKPKKSASTTKSLKRNLAKKKATSRKKAAKKKTAPKKPAAKKPVEKKPVARKNAASKKPAARTVSAPPARKIRRKGQDESPLVLPRRGTGADAGGQSGDLQGLSIREDVDSESVSELIEEGNAFEADVVKGVEDADNADEGEVHTHEVPEDDVPGEYLDKD
jgi:hypothetical protein